MSTERTTVGLDVHARSVVAEAIDWQTGDWDRFTGASIGAYLGLVPSESRLSSPLCKRHSFGLVDVGQYVGLMRPG